MSIKWKFTMLFEKEPPHRSQKITNLQEEANRENFSFHRNCMWFINKIVRHNRSVSLERCYVHSQMVYCNILSDILYRLRRHRRRRRLSTANTFDYTNKKNLRLTHRWFILNSPWSRRKEHSHRGFYIFFCIYFPVVLLSFWNATHTHKSRRTDDYSFSHFVQQPQQQQREKKIAFGSETFAIICASPSSQWVTQICKHT